MPWNNLRIEQKLAIGFGVVLAFILAVTYISYLGQRSTMADAELAARHKDLVADLKERMINHLEWTLGVSQGLVSRDMRSMEAQIDPGRCRFGQWYYGQDRRRLEELAPSTSRTLQALEEPHNRLHKSVHTILDIYRQGGPDHLLRAKEVFTSETLPSLESFQTRLHGLEDEIARLSDGISETSASYSGRTLIMVAGAGTAAALVGLLLALALAGSITGPLRRVISAADRIAEGDLDQALQPTARKDEIGSLQNAFARMNGSLLGVARSMERIARGELTLEVEPQSERDLMGKALKAMTISLHELARTNRETVAVLASSVDQLSASAAQLSASSAETATAVNETTATVAEVRQTAQLTSERANLVAENSRRATEAARLGARASEEAMQGMRLISEKMDFIAQNIVKLSEKSQDIGEIFGAVRGLADQSNILAVNAAIEASRAGEEGKSFAVVAAEIRSLAEQSKEAIRQIRSGLEDIQKATVSSVMATEEGGKAVVNGRDKAAASREAFLAMSDSITEASEAALQIAASSKEELLGMEQVRAAMENIRQASSQNMESASQLEESVRGLSNLSNDLITLAERYRV